MKLRYALSVFTLALLPLVARADRPPDFESDAKPILAEQPGLVAYVHKHFEVRETGVAARGNGDQPPRPPFIFSARPRGHSGPFYLRLLIQPGPPGQILKVADIRKLPPGQPAPDQEQPEVGSAPPSESAPTQSSSESSQPLQPPADTDSTRASSSTEPTSATPSGPIHN